MFLKVVYLKVVYEALHHLHCGLFVIEPHSKCQLRLSVPRGLVFDMENIVFKYNLKQVKIVEWNIQWNDYAYDVEWENMFGDIILSYKHHIVEEVGDLYDFLELNS
ncbi:Hypothetical_protein [Hexamita inflata]|uniref:Hypothetical_protein n=1 Tax=Hexamita inflata TaxID=28002 RepID=A0AA86NDM7_9EUKA|nr:Hypothetical protein HINF_LOCUS5274 [Hexamita inflata]CAI9918654.1 Hypothetical protein HINF_LOCUS6299 [Hexamita inflata]